MEIDSVGIEDSHYPKSLKSIQNPPRTLYYKGVLPSDQEILVAIVGTRHPSSYGQQTALQFSEYLSQAGAVVISGMAPGIDTLAHRACIEKKRRTIAVLGTGLDDKSLYPKSNLELSRKIVEYGGCLMSELPPGTPGSRFSFPKRNRIVAGLSRGILVIEAKEKSGSLITAEYALKQQKQLFAVPGSIYSLNSKGPNQLIQKGAQLVIEAEDIARSLDLQFNQKEKIVLPDTNEESLILKALLEEPLYIDKIIEKTKLQPSIVATSLALMEISGKVRSLGGNIYSLS